jgi:FAD dependent oxidoreductase TIGR03364
VEKDGMNQRANVAVVGGGILGLAHAWAAARRGHTVVLFERDRRARGASVRNFGMVWPIGQPPGPLHELALRSRAAWLELGDRAGIWVHPCGSLHLAYADDERAVLEEFAGRADALGYACELLDAAGARRHCPAVQADGLRAALWSPTELCVDPRQALAQLPLWLHEAHGVDLHYGTAVCAVELPQVRATDGRVWEVDQAVVCSGIDFQTLFPEVFAAAGLRRCKLQMMRTVPQPAGWRLGPHLAGGLTLCHYPAFRTCAALAALQQRVAAQWPEYVRYGIHVMASQNHLGEVVIGDSHEYDEAIEPFDKAAIDGLILDYLRRMVRLPDETIAGRWHGHYAKHPTLPVFSARPRPGVTVMTAPGGAGMTLSFGLALDWWETGGRSLEGPWTPIS